MNNVAPLFAVDIVFLIKVAVPLIAAVIWVLNQALAKAKKLPQQQPGAAPPPRRPAAKAVEDEVEAFLRRAAQARAGQPAQAPQRPQRAAVGGRLEQAAPAARSTARRPPPLPAAAVEVVGERSVGGEGVADHVARHLDSSTFTERAAHLTHLDQADEQMEARIHQSLDHHLGQLAPQESAVAMSAAGPSGQAVAVVGLGAFLANPQNLRNAFIMNEVFRRPDV
jgi:hypothetical protein